MKTNRLTGVMLGAILCWGIAVTAARAQMRAMPPDPYDPNTAATQSQPASQSTAAALPRQADVELARFQGATDYPAAAIQAVPVAKARATVARAVYDRARSSLYSAVDNLQEDFEYSPEFQADLRDEKAAHDAYVAARNHALAQLDSDVQYQALKKLAENLSRKLDDLHQHPARNREQILATASVKLDYTSKMSQMQNDILIADSAVQQARTRLLESGARVADMRSQFNRTVRRDTTFASARRAMDDAKIAYLGADAYLQSSVNTAAIALDYAYWLHRYDPYTNYSWSYVNNTYPLYSYGTSVYPWRVRARY